MSDDSEEQDRKAHAQALYSLAASMMRWGMWLGLPAALISIGLAGVLIGRDGIAGAGFGAVLGFGSALITLAMMRRAATRPPSALLGLALGGYALKMAALLGVMLLLRDVPTVHGPALAFGLLATVVAWAAADVIAFQRTKLPTIVPARPPVSVSESPVSASESPVSVSE